MRLARAPGALLVPESETASVFCVASDLLEVLLDEFGFVTMVVGGVPMVSGLPVSGLFVSGVMD